MVEILHMYMYIESCSTFKQVVLSLIWQMPHTVKFAKANWTLDINHNAIVDFITHHVIIQRDCLVRISLVIKHLVGISIIYINWPDASTCGKTIRNLDFIVARACSFRTTDLKIRLLSRREHGYSSIPYFLKKNSKIARRCCSPWLYTFLNKKILQASTTSRQKVISQNILSSRKTAYKNCLANDW